ncbi:unnamed protein product [Sphagnum jensenii]|uniref:Uncharacterized protein n=1 Tax=Sphagnum jensenii TaxID=128206 RepID=A0ABP0VRP5_9BRYO
MRVVDDAQAEDRRTDLHVESFNLTRDGSVDQYGRVADKRKTGGWKAAPLIFAYLGRFWAIAVFATIKVVGMMLLALSAVIPSLRPPPCPANPYIPCQAAYGYQIGGVDNVGFSWGFGIPAAVMLLAVVIFMAGSNIYRFKAPQGSPLTTIAQVAVAAAWKQNVGPLSDEAVLYTGPILGSGPIEKLCHTEQFRQVPCTHHLFPVHMHQNHKEEKQKSAVQ